VWRHWFAHLTQALSRLHISSAADDKKIVSHLHINLCSNVLHRRRRVSPRRPMYLLLMMIAFITIKSSLVPLIEVLYAQIYFRFEISLILLTSSSFIFCESRIALLCHALRVCVAHAPTESCPFSLLVHWDFQACYNSHLPLLHPPCHEINVFKRSFWGSRFERLVDAFVSLVILIFLYPQNILISVRWLSNSRMYSVWWFLLITMPSGLRFQKRFS